MRYTKAAMCEIKGDRVECAVSGYSLPCKCMDEIGGKVRVRYGRQRVL